MSANGKSGEGLNQYEDYIHADAANNARKF